MNRTPNPTPEPARPGVSMRKDGSAAPTRWQPPPVAIPRSIDLLCLAIVLEAVFTLARALVLRGSTSQLTQWLITQNDKAKGKNHKSPYGSAQVAHDLSQVRSAALFQGLIVAAALVLLAYAVRRTRVASGARWAVLVVIVLTSAPLSVIPVSGWPFAPKAASVLMGVASIAAIAGILVPPSMRYFRECKVAARPPGAPARPGLFGPRTPPASRGARQRPSAARRPAPDPGAGPAEANNPARGKAKAKVRADADAVARGADLARARAKASKSRRAE